MNLYELVKQKCGLDVEQNYNLSKKRYESTAVSAEKGSSDCCDIT